MIKNGCYTGTSIATFHSVLPFYNVLVVTNDYTISLRNPPTQSPCSTWFSTYFSSSMLPSLTYLFFQNLCRLIRRRSTLQYIIIIMVVKCSSWMVLCEDCAITTTESASEWMAWVRACNSIKFETGRNLPPVLKIVTHTAHAAWT